MKPLSRLARLAPVVLVIAIIIVAPPVFADAPAKFPVLLIHSGERETFTDGTLAAHYRLSFGGENPVSHCQGIQTFWRPGGVFAPGKDWFSLPARCDATGCDVKLHTGGMVFFTLLAEARCDGVVYQAQTIGSLHAAGSRPNRVRPVADSEPASVTPWLELIPSPAHYYPQTGMTFFFHYQKSPDDVEISGNDPAGLIKAGVSNSGAKAGGDFQFTPSHDAALNRLGSEASSERIVIVREKPGGPVSAFTLDVHRSRFAFLHLKSGMALFAGVAAVSAALVFSLKKQSWRR